MRAVIPSHVLIPSHRVRRSKCRDSGEQQHTNAAAQQRAERQTHTQQQHPLHSLLVCRGGRVVCWVGVSSDNGSMKYVFVV
eukprot:scaffold22069_cov122-Isochrysis_galbana.AAC.12